LTRIYQFLFDRLGQRGFNYSFITDSVTALANSRCPCINPGIYTWVFAKVGQS